MTKKTCLVISPIGNEGSEIREKADHVFEYFITPALEAFGFEVIRSDKLTNLEKISDQIINYIQTAELCIADMTGHNPNVFYELGRRHETAKPCIQIIKKGELIPFDVADMRTVEYDLDDFISGQESQKRLKEFIKGVEREGYSDSGSSLQNVSDTLKRIEKKINSITTPKNDTVTMSAARPEGFSDNPVTFYYQALEAGKYQLAADAIKRYMKINKDYNLLLDMATVIIEKYDASGVEIARQIMDEHSDEITPGQYATTLFALYKLYDTAMTLENEKEYMFSIVTGALERDNVDKEDKARLVNVLSSVEFSLGNYETALDYDYKAIDYVDNEPVYYYNQAKTYEKMPEMTLKMFKHLDKIIELHRTETYTAPHVNGLEYALEMYTKLSPDEENKIEEIQLLLRKFTEENMDQALT